MSCPCVWSQTKSYLLLLDLDNESLQLEWYRALLDSIKCVMAWWGRHTQALCLAYELCAAAGAHRRSSFVGRTARCMRSDRVELPYP